MKELIGYKKGINLGGWLSQCNHQKDHYDNFFTEEDIKEIASLDVDHVRLPVDYELLETEDGLYKEEGFFYIDTCFKWCEKYDLNMILDLHKTAGYTFTQPETAEEFFRNEKLQNRFISLWIQFSKRYARYKDRMAFELLNEIVSYDVAKQWNELAKKTIKAIRAYLPEVKILVGGVSYNSIFTVRLLDDFMDENVVYNFHCYEPFVFTHQCAEWVSILPKDLHLNYPGKVEDYLAYSSTAVKNIIAKNDITEFNSTFFDLLFQEAVQYAEDNNVALYCGEYGVIDYADPKSTLRWFQDIHASFEKHNIGRAVWTYKKMVFGIADKHYEEIYKELTQYL